MRQQVDDFLGTPLYGGVLISDLLKGEELVDSIPEKVKDGFRGLGKKTDTIYEMKAKLLEESKQGDDHIKGLIGLGKIQHIHHWANPMVNKSNIVPTYAIERDSGYDFVIHTKPDNMRGQLYEITTGDEDILFSVAYGAIPISGIDHIGFEDDGNTLMKVSGLSFGKDTSHKKIAKIITLNQTPALFNEAFGKCRARVENRITTAPAIVARYYGAMLGRELARARTELGKEAQIKMDKAEQEKADAIENRGHKDIRKPDAEPEAVEAVESTDKPDNVVEGNFGKDK